MKSYEIVSKILKSFERYYSIKKKFDSSSSDAEKIEDAVAADDTVTEPFFAEAEFNSHTEQYFLIKSAKISESDSSEHVFFYAAENLNADELAKIESKSWETGLSRVVPHFGHRNTDVTLVIACDRIDDDAFRRIRKISHSKSYMLTFKGWSNFRVIALETSSKKIAYNRLGKDLKKTIEAVV